MVFLGLAGHLGGWPGRRQNAVVVPITITNGSLVVGAVQTLSNVQALSSVACSSATSCVAVGGSSFQGVVVSITNGVAGAAQFIADDDGGLTGVACYGPTACVAVGNNFPLFESDGVVVLISNGTAGAAQLVTTTSTLNRVACRVSICEATGALQSPPFAAVLQITNGVPGAPQVLPDSGGGVNTLLGISCPSDTFCEAVGNAQTGVVVPVHSGVPAAPMPVPDTGGLNGIACTAATDCIAVGSNPDSTLGVVVTVAPDNTPPRCFVSAVRAGPPKQLDLTAQDAGSGIASITVVSVSNGTVDVPDFTPGTTSPVVITATKTDQSKPTVFNVDVTDVDGNTTHCR